MHQRRDLLLVLLFLLCVPCLVLGLFGSLVHSVDRKAFPSDDQKIADYTAFIQKHESALLRAQPGDEMDGVLFIEASQGATVFVMHDLFTCAPSGFYYSPQDIPLPIFLPEGTPAVVLENVWQYEAVSTYYIDRCLTYRLLPCWFFFEQYTLER